MHCEIFRKSAAVCFPHHPKGDLILSGIDSVNIICCRYFMARGVMQELMGVILLMQILKSKKQDTV